jgi:hypothetical protein
MKEELDSDTVISDMMESTETTDQDGNSSALVTELESQVNNMRGNTKGVLSGLTKLDECVDANEKFVIVRLGWKPSLSEAAADSRQKINSEVKRGDSTSLSGATASRSGTRASAPVSTASASGATDCDSSGPRVKTVTVTVEGNGSDLRRATNDGLRSAISQVFGEQFSSSTKMRDLTKSAEVSGAFSLGLVVETSETLEEVNSKTKGLIKSYKYLSKNDASSGLKVILEVSLSKYCTGIDPNKLRAIVLPPKFSPSIKGGGGDVGVFNQAVQDSIEELLNQTKKITVLDRRFLKDQMQELSRISAGNSPISELARLGNTAGADIMVVSEIISFDQINEKKKLGAQVLERTVFNAEVSVKVINVATTNMMLSQRVPFRKMKIKSSNPASGFGQKVGSKIAQRIAGRLGGGLQRGTTLSSFPAVDVRASEKRAKKSYEEVKEGVKNDW